MSRNYEIELNEDTIKKDDEGNILHHPLNTHYSIGDKYRTSYGYLTFAGHDLALSGILDDVQVYYVHFHGPRGGPYGQRLDDRELWAHPLRIEILRQLAGNDYHWFLSFDGDIRSDSESNEYISIDRDLEEGLLQKYKLDSAVVQSERPYGHGTGFRPRLFFESPTDLLPVFVNRYWSLPWEGFDIEGYLLPPGSIDILKKWDNQERDDKLFRDVIDRTIVAFYCFPGYPRDFVFHTNKYSLVEFGNVIDVQHLGKMAVEIGAQLKESDSE